jgi:hypothetical protein
VTDEANWTVAEYATWRAAQPGAADDLSGIVSGIEPARAAGSGSRHAEVVALLNRAGAKRSR